MTDEKKPIIALEERASAQARLFSPSAARNRDFIRDVFLRTMPRRGVILEVGSGTGEHCLHLAAASPALRFLPGDPDAASRASIAAWTAHGGLSNIAPPHDADVAIAGWDKEFQPCDGVLSVNMIHIAPFAAAEGLFAGAGRLLKEDGRLFLYGPFSRNGAHTAPSNEAFDQSLKMRDPRWGVRDLDHDIAPLAAKAGLKLQEVVDMPANNFSVVFARR
ncbi:MAG TPA: DUF938 domain-containing protein [Parvularculaceae bacterium]|nr:DUF938 domain-containing protein [Parvularculaceae bacterium]